jgi:hypothetical protein
MAIVQISRITNRKGLTENLPQLAGAEFGWCVDSRRLFIGNGTLQEGAPVIGNTEILTEFSDITVLSDYTYEDIVVGYAAQTGPTPGSPVVRSVQARLDDYVSVRAFGAVGDGDTDDTDAINRALFQLYCRDINTQVRRSLFFPAGTYRVTDTIIIPAFAKLMGEGADSSVIVLDTRGDSAVPLYVARTGDSLQQIGPAIGSNNAITPRDIEISSMGFQTVDQSSVFFVEATRSCWFSRVDFRGPVTVDDLLESSFNPSVTDISGLSFSSLPVDSAVPGITSRDIVIDSCGFYNMTYGATTDQTVEAVTISNSAFDTLYHGVVLTNRPTGFRIVHNSFDQVFAEGIVFNGTSLNASAYNIFYNVGRNIGSSSPTTAIIRFGSDNNVSVGDMFERSYADSLLVPIIEVFGTTVGSGTSQMRLGRYARDNGKPVILSADTTDGAVVTVNGDRVAAFDIEYRIIRSINGTTAIRSGCMTVIRGPSDDSSDDSSWTDDYTENFDTEILLDVEQSGDAVSVRYTSTPGAAATMLYSLKYLA